MVSIKMEIESFLSEVNSLIKSHKFDFVPTQKNREMRRKYGLTIDDIFDIINSLSYIDYSSGPQDDHDSSLPEKLWVFGKKYKGIIIYIKLKIRNSSTVVACLSFHETAYLHFPYQSKEGV